MLGAGSGQGPPSKQLTFSVNGSRVSSGSADEVSLGGSGDEAGGGDIYSAQSARFSDVRTSLRAEDALQSSRESLSSLVDALGQMPEGRLAETVRTEISAIEAQSNAIASDSELSLPESVPTYALSLATPAQISEASAELSDAISALGAAERQSESEMHGIGQDIRQEHTSAASNLSLAAAEGAGQNAPGQDGSGMGDLLRQRLAGSGLASDMETAALSPELGSAPMDQQIIEAVFYGEDEVRSGSGGAERVRGYVHVDQTPGKLDDVA